MAAARLVLLLTLLSAHTLVTQPLCTSPGSPRPFSRSRRASLPFSPLHTDRRLLHDSPSVRLFKIGSTSVMQPSACGKLIWMRAEAR